MTQVLPDLKALAAAAIEVGSVPVKKGRKQGTKRKDLSLGRKRSPVKMAIRKSGKAKVGVQSFDSDVPRDATRHGIETQIERLQHNRDRIGRRLVKAAKSGDMLKVNHLSGLLANTNARISLLHNRLERLA